MAADITIMALTNILKKEINKIISTGNTSQNIYKHSFLSFQGFQPIHYLNDIGSSCGQQLVPVVFVTNILKIF